MDRWCGKYFADLPWTTGPVQSQTGWDNRRSPGHDALAAFFSSWRLPIVNSACLSGFSPAKILSGDGQGEAGGLIFISPGLCYPEGEGGLSPLSRLLTGELR
jgi:hypothetical protein